MLKYLLENFLGNSQPKKFSGNVSSDTFSTSGARVSRFVEYDLLMMINCNHLLIVINRL